LEDDPDYWDRLRFYAIMQFFIKKGHLNKLNTELYKKWIRVCFNLINNTLVQSPDTFYKAIRSIKKLSENIDDLYEYLSKPETRIDGFLQNKVRKKNQGSIILDSKNWEIDILI